MEICGQSQQKKHGSMEISRITCRAEYRTKERCGCEFIKPVSGFECHLCRVFIRNGNDIEGHISLLQHKTFYQIHLQDHYQDQNGVNHNLTNVNTDSRSDEVTANRDHGIVEGFNSARNCFATNLVYDGGHEKERYPGIMDTDNVTKDQFGVSDSDQRPNGSSGICNTLLEKEREGRFDGRQVKIDVDNIKLNQRLSVTERHTRDNYPFDLSNTSSQGEQEGGITALTIKKEDDGDDNNDFHEDDHDNEDGITGLFSDDSDCESVSLANKALKIKQEYDDGDHNDFHEDEHEDEDGVIGGFLDDSDGESVSLANKALKIKQEDDDADYNVFHEDDHDNEDSSIGGFLEGGDGESVNLDEHYDGELMPGYEIDSDFKTESSGQEISHEVSSFATSTSIVEETCTSTTSISGKQRPASNSENGQKSGINDHSKADTCEKTLGEDSNLTSEANLSTDINTCDDPQSLGKGSCEKRKSKHNRDIPLSYDVNGESCNLNSNLKVHERIAAEKDTYSFDMCGMKFARLNSFKKHTMATGEHSFSCYLCGTFFEQKTALRKHERVHTAAEPFSCDMSGNSVDQVASLRRHEQVHTCEKPFSCDVCLMKFKSSSDRNRHRMVHTCDRPFSCNVCGKSFKLGFNLKVHAKLHTGDRPFLCHVCGKSFKKKEHVQRHETIHSEARPFSCNICGKSFKRNALLKKHETIHTGERPYSCNVCGKSFKLGYNLKAHAIVHTGERPFLCHFCGKSFKKKEHLQKHESVHSEARPFLCNVCGKSFKIIGILKRHEKMHKVQTLYSSEECGMKFSRSSTCKQHKRKHTGERPFFCNICDKSFKRRDHLKRHKMVHGGPLSSNALGK